jgi:hypothetical protein
MGISSFFFSTRRKIALVKGLGIALAALIIVGLLLAKFLG